MGRPCAHGQASPRSSVDGEALILRGCCGAGLPLVRPPRQPACRTPLCAPFDSATDAHVAQT
eukprot:scaffold265877_cov32-Tisochrysis_lutea.AAC.3